MKYFYTNFVDDLKTRVSKLILEDDPHDKVFAIFKDYFYKEDFDSCLEILETLNNLQKEDDEETIGASCCALESLINTTYSLLYVYINL